MQAEFLGFLRDRPTAMIPEGALVHRTVEAEMPLYRRGQIISYVDAAETLTINLTTTVSLFEIKPRIETVFGIIRQLKATLALAEQSIKADHHYCHAIVPHDDPHLTELRRWWPYVWAWGVTFEPIEIHDAVE